MNTLITRTTTNNLAGELTAAGVEYEFTWNEPAVLAGAKAYARLTLPTTKYHILNFRELVMDTERGFYRAFTGFTGGTVATPISIFKTRSDSSITPLTSITKFSAPTSIDLATKTIDLATKTIDKPLFGAAGGGAASPSGDLLSDSSVHIFSPNIEILLEFENASASTCYFQGTFKFFETTVTGIPGIRNI